MKYVLSAVIGYLLGSVSVSILVSKLLFRDDIRTHGSGNAGATNMARIFGALPGVLTLAGDMCKAFISAGIGHALCGEAGKLIGLTACVIGHCFPVYFRFKGGKAMSVGVAVAFLMDWRAGLISAAVFFLVFFLYRRVSASSVSSAVTLVISYAILNGVRSWEFALVCFTAAILIFMHRANIRWIIEGTKPEFKFKT